MQNLAIRGTGLAGTGGRNVNIGVRLPGRSTRQVNKFVPSNKIMSSEANRKALAVVEDLFFTVKINESAKRAGMPIEFVKSEQDALEKAKGKPPLIILDLNFAGIDPVGLITKLKENQETRSISVIGYVSHVQGELKQKAQEAGCDMVMARSAFSQNLPQILKTPHQFLLTPVLTNYFLLRRRS